MAQYIYNIYRDLDAFSAGVNKLKIMVLGKAGDGKTALINTILGKKSTLEYYGTQCKVTEGVFEEVPVVFIDTPGLLRTDLKENKLEVIKGIACAAPGPHVFLYVRNSRSFTTVEEKSATSLESIFKHSKSHFLGVVMSDGAIPENVEREIKKSFMGKFSGFIVFNKKVPNVSELMNKIKEISDNQGHYTSEQYEKMDPTTNIGQIIEADSKEKLSKLLGKAVYTLWDKCLDKMVDMALDYLD